MKPWRAPRQVPSGPPPKPVWEVQVEWALRKIHL